MAVPKVAELDLEVKLVGVSLRWTNEDIRRFHVQMNYGAFVEVLQTQGDFVDDPGEGEI